MERHPDLLVVLGGDHLLPLKGINAAVRAEMNRHLTHLYHPGAVAPIRQRHIHHGSRGKDDALTLEKANNFADPDKSLRQAVGNFTGNP